MNEDVVRIDGVTFIVAACQKFTKDQFVKFHIDSFWLDKDTATRKEMLVKAYEMVKPKKEKTTD